MDGVAGHPGRSKDFRGAGGSFHRRSAGGSRPRGSRADAGSGAKPAFANGCARAHHSSASCGYGSSGSYHGPSADGSASPDGNPGAGAHRNASPCANGNTTAPPDIDADPRANGDAEHSCRPQRRPAGAGLHRDGRERGDDHAVRGHGERQGGAGLLLRDVVTDVQCGVTASAEPLLSQQR